MKSKEIFSLIDNLLDLTFRFLDIFDGVEDTGKVDKKLIINRIEQARDKVAYWNDNNPSDMEIKETPEGVTVAVNGNPMINGNDGTGNIQDGPFPESKPVNSND